MAKNLLVTDPKTRINDLFVGEGSPLDMSIPLQSSKDPLIQGRPNQDHRFYADFYRYIGIDIVTETAMHYPYPLITEKTYRPIASGRPFIILGPYRTLEFLRSLGFSTFPSIIDESYDLIYNPEQRFLSVCQTIKKIVDQPIEQTIADIKSVRESLLHNQYHLQYFVKDQLQNLRKQIEID